MPKIGNTTFKANNTHEIEVLKHKLAELQAIVNRIPTYELVRIEDEIMMDKLTPEFLADIVEVRIGEVGTPYLASRYWLK